MINKPSDLFSNMDWSDLQTQYLDALNSFNDSLPGKSKQSTPQEQWLKALDFWWQSNKGAVPQEQRGFYSHLLNQGKSMYFLAEQFSQMSDAVSSMDQKSNDWVKTIEKQINSMKESFQTKNDMGVEGFQDILGNFSSPNDAWSNFSNSIPGFAQGLGSNFYGLNPNDSEWEQMIEKFISIPGVGHNRELHEKIQKNILLYKNYQKVNDEYNQAMSKVGVEALDKLKIKLVDLSRGDEKIKTLRQIYNLWVDCNEEAYAEYVFSEDYSKLNGRLVNSLMLYKKHHSELMEELFAGLNIPSSSQLEDLIHAQQGLRRKLKQAEEEKADNQSRLDMLEQELKALRAEMKLGKTSSSKTGTATTDKSKQSRSTKKKNIVKAVKKSKIVKKKKVTRKKARKKTTKKSDQDVIEIKF